jgi:hypothetical protein
MTLSLAPPTTPAARSPSGGGLLATIQGTASNLTITRTVPPPAKNTWGTGTISGMTFRLTPTFAYDRIALPYWPVVAIVLTPAWISALVALARARRGIMRRRRGLCVKCGYDLRGSAFESACPECGVAFKRDQKNAEAAAATTTS